MPPKHVAPSVDLQSFSCPVCGALAHQRWHDVGALSTKDDVPPNLYRADRVAEVKEEQRILEPSERHIWDKLFAYADRAATGAVFLEMRETSAYCNYDLINIHISRCQSCDDITIWKFDTILYPPSRYEIEPSVDLPDDIRADFDEAREVLDKSPRSAAALLRLCIQKLCKHLGEVGDNINADIGALVRKGLDARVQKALDVVRVVGNNAVHPGTLDLKDDRGTAGQLFTLVNRIAYDMITHPKEVDALFDTKLSQGQKDQIAKRDAPKGKA